MANLKLSRQLMKEIYTKKMQYEREILEDISMSEFIEECLMNYLDINIVDMNDDKLPTYIDMYYDNHIFNEKETDKTDIETDNLESYDISFTNYVYVYMNPLKKLNKSIILDISGEEFVFEYEPFYIGKGKGDRMFQHLKEDNRDVNYNKKDIIKNIQSQGYEPIIKIIKNGLTEYESYTLEGIIISNLDNLTNMIGGKSKKNEYKSDSIQNSIEYEKNKQILTLISQGLKNKEISKKLGISERTLYRLKSNFKNKL